MPAHPTPKAPRIMPPIGLFMALGTQLFLAAGVPEPRLIPAPLHWLGVVPLVVAVAIFTRCVGLFGAHDTTIRPGGESAALIAEGPYEFSRNPIYLCMVLLLSGIAMLTNTLLGWLPVVVFALWIRWRFIPLEEAMLRQRFGDRYMEYCRRVRRWL